MSEQSTPNEREELLLALNVLLLRHGIAYPLSVPDALADFILADRKGREAKAAILKHYIPRKEVVEAIKVAASNPISKPEIGPRDVNGAYLLGISNGKWSMSREIKQKLHLEERDA